MAEKKLRIKQVRSIIGRPARQKRTMEALGLRRINHTRPSLCGRNLIT